MQNHLSVEDFTERFVAKYLFYMTTFVTKGIIFILLDQKKKNFLQFGQTCCVLFSSTNMLECKITLQAHPATLSL
jgi:hypothetical protein